MRQVPLSPLSFDPQRVANVPEHPPPSTRLRSCAHIANRRLSRIIGARCGVIVYGLVLEPFVAGRVEVGRGRPKPPPAASCGLQQNPQQPKARYSFLTNRPSKQCQFSTPVGLYCERAIHRVQAAEYDQHVVALNVLLLMPA